MRDRERGWLEIVFGLFLGLVALALAAFGLSIAAMTFTGGSRDSPYLLIGCLVLAVAALFAIPAWWALSTARHPLGWGLIGAIALALVLLLFGTSVFGRALDVPVQIALAFLGLGAAVAAVRQRRSAG